MTKDQFSKAAKYITNGEDLLFVDDTILHGCALPTFSPVYCGIKQVGKLLRYQCLQFNGEVDAQELDNMARIARKKFMVV